MLQTLIGLVKVFPILRIGFVIPEPELSLEAVVVFTVNGFTTIVEVEF